MKPKLNLHVINLGAQEVDIANSHIEISFRYTSKLLNNCILFTRCRRGTSSSVQPILCDSVVASLIQIVNGQIGWIGMNPTWRGGCCVEVNSDT